MSGFLGSSRLEATNSLDMLAEAAENNAVIQRAHNEEKRLRNFNTTAKKGLSASTALEINRQFAKMPKLNYQEEAFPAGNGYNTNATIEEASNTNVVQAAPAPRTTGSYRKRKINSLGPPNARGLSRSSGSTFNLPSPIARVNNTQNFENYATRSAKKTKAARSRNRRSRKNRKNRSTRKRKATTRTSA